jgi:hypothetical protein
MRLLDMDTIVLTADSAYAISCGVPDDTGKIFNLNIAALKFT